MVTADDRIPRKLFARTMLNPARAALALGRAGLSDPFLGAAYAAAIARWGPSLAAAYSAAARRHPTRAAVVDDDGDMTFAGLERWTDALAGAISDSIGEGIGARPMTIGILCRNHRGFVAAAIVAAKLGANAVYLNTGFAGPQLREVLTREGVTHLIHDAEFAALSEEAGRTPTWDSIVTDGDPNATGRPGSATFATLAALRHPAPRRPRQASLPILLTSGTTGTPKGARRGRPTLDAAGSAGLLTAVPYRTSDVFVVPAPLFHAWGLSQMMLAAALGSTLVVRRRFDPDVLLADIEHYRVTVLAAVPVMLQRVLSGTEPGHHDTSSLRIVAVSGSALAGSLAIEWMDRFGDSLYNVYGSTEVGQATVAGPADLRHSPGTAGSVLPGARVQILDDDGVALARGQTGRIFVGSPHRFTGYTGGGGKAEVAGLLETGDFGYFDTRDRLFVSGRQDDMIVSGGENVFPSEVEDLLADHPAIEEVAVIGVADPLLGQRLRAVVVRRPGARLTATQVKDHVRTNLARHKVPRDVVFIAALPRNLAGKVLRKELR